MQIVNELTEFLVDADATAWWIPGRGWNRYEFIYREDAAVGDRTGSHAGNRYGLKSGVHLAIHEAALVGYAGYVIDQRRPGVLRTNLTPWSDGTRV